MTNETQNDDDVTKIDLGPQATTKAPSTAAPIRTKRKSTLGRNGAIALVGFLAVGAAFSQLGGKELVNSHFASAPRMDATPAGAQLAESERYRNNLQQVNITGAETALATTRQSFIATPDKPVEAALRDIDEPAAEPVVKKPKLPGANKPQVTQAAPEKEIVLQTVTQEVPVYYEFRRDAEVRDDYTDIDALSQAMAAQAGGLTGLTSGLSRNEIIIEQELYTAPDGRPVGMNVGRGAASQPPAGAGTAPGAPATLPQQSSSLTSGGTYGADLEVGLGALHEGPRLNLPVRTGAMPYAYDPYGYGSYGEQTRPSSILAKAGSVSYARIINGTDTDTPGPIIAEITSGNLKGARLIGSFTPNREVTNMIVSFDQVVLEDGTIIGTSAYAVDALYGDLAIRSNYDGRYFQRYAPRLAGAFVRGAGEAFAQTQTTVVGLGQGAVGILAAEPTLREAVAGGVADVGDQLASEIEDIGPEDGLVQLYANKPIGVLFLANVDNRL